MLLTKIKEDQVKARKDRATELAVFLTTLYSEIATVGKNDGNRETTDDEAIVVLKKFIKNANEVMDNIPTTDDRHLRAASEIEIVNDYLPTQMSENELSAFIETVISVQGLSSPRDMGVVMKELKECHAGLYDGKMASAITKSLLVG